MLRVLIFVVFPIAVLMISCQGEALILKGSEPIHLIEDLIISEGDSLIIEPGTEVVLDSGVNIIAYGNVIIRGTAANPVYIHSANIGERWGYLKLKSEAKKLFIEHAIIKDGLITSYKTDNYFNKVIFKNKHELEENEALARFWYGKVHIKNCQLKGNNQGQGFLLHSVERPQINNCFFNEIPNAIEFIDCKNGRIASNQFQSMTENAINQKSCKNTLIENNQTFHLKGYAIEIGNSKLGNEKHGYSDSILVKNNLIVGCYKGVFVKESSFVMIEQSTFYNNSFGIDIHTSTDSSRFSRAEISRSVITGKFKPFRKNDRSEVQLTQCWSNKELPSGEKNLLAPVEFQSIKNSNYEIISDELPEGATRENLGFQYE